MDASTRHKLLQQLWRNLTAGWRLAMGMRVSRDDFAFSLEQGLLLLLINLALDLGVAYLVVDPPAVYSPYGLNYLGSLYLINIVVLLLVGRIAGARAPDAVRLVFVSFATGPVSTLVTAGSGLMQQSDLADGQLLIIATVLPLVWGVYISLRQLRVILLIRFGKSFGLAVVQVGAALGVMSLLPYTQVWYTEEQDDAASNPYFELYRLSQENLFYDQSRLVDQALANIAQQRPGVSDLYLIAVGGYGLEDVFLNEVEYVRDLFDERFGTRDRSAVLVNNVKTVNRYPMANGHNLSALLDRVAERMDTEEDILFLFMTSHGSRDHHFSLDYGPISLDDLTPVQVRQALDDAGIRWRVIVVSSCYSGGFIEPLKDPHTLVITAAAADRTSFGCGARSEFTDFGTAYFRNALHDETDFIAAYDVAANWIADKEQRERRTPSLPQRFVGEAMPSKLASFAATLHQVDAVRAASSAFDACSMASDFTDCAGYAR